MGKGWNPGSKKSWKKIDGEDVKSKKGGGAEVEVVVGGWANVGDESIDYEEEATAAAEEEAEAIETEAAAAAEEELGTGDSGSSAGGESEGFEINPCYACAGLFGLFILLSMRPGKLPAKV